MDKNAIKKYAVWARNELISRVAQKADQYGITEAEIISASEDSIYGRLLTPAEKKQRTALIERIKTKGYKQVIEEVAYVWFNRFTALRFMEVNGYLPSYVRVFTDATNKFEPQILAEAIHLDMAGLNMEKVYELKQANKTEELYKYLLITQCNALNEILPGMFQKIEDYTELLLPDNLLREGSVIEQMITLIPEEDWTKQIEILGWLYQYYISEKHEQVVDPIHGKAIKKEDIPAATQLFTTDWVVRYMVDNSLGRYWIERHPESNLADKLEYYVKPKNGDIHYINEAVTPQEMTFFDPCMGSGHILVYAFDVLLEIYRECGYSDRDAVSEIVQNNIYGLDIDDRCSQLAYFAVMMKARSYDRRFLSRGLIPNVCSIEESNTLGTFARANITNDNEQNKIGEYLVKIFRDAKEIGSATVISDYDYEGFLEYLETCYEQSELNMDLSYWVQHEKPIIEQLAKQALILTKKYAVVCTNPPYLGKLDGNLKNYVNLNFKDYSSDLFSVFMYHNFSFCLPNGYSAFMTPNVWMFIKTYEKLRRYILTHKSIITLIQMAKGAFFKEATVDICAFVFANKPNAENGLYIRLEDFKGNMEIQKEKVLEALATDNCRYFYQCDESKFSKIPGSPIAYWISEEALKAFEGKILYDVARPRQGMATTNNDLFLRLWHEVSQERIGFGFVNTEKAKASNRKWFPINKGGEFRRWYGNNYYIVNYENDGKTICDYIDNTPGARVKSNGRVINRDMYFHKGMTWSTISSGLFSMRYVPNGFIFETKGAMCFADDSLLLYLLGLYNTKVMQEYLQIVSPTLDYHEGPLGKTPVVIDEKHIAIISDLVQQNTQNSKADWDAFEISWDFTTHPFVKYSNSLWDATAIGATMSKYYGRELPLHNSPLELCYLLWQGECTDRFATLKANEEELNRLFIDIYGLNEELSPEVTDKDVTVRKADLGRDIRSFISYAVGCMFGRYSLNVDGIAYAGGEWDDEKYISFKADKDNVLPICDDEYFEDDIVGKFVKFVEVVYGKDSLEANLKFIADALGGNGSPRDVIRSYFLNDFYADHLKIYQKRPIYWQFDSGKKNGFKCLIYMHRYQPDTIARIRTDYVHEQQARYRTAIADLEQRIQVATTSERVKLTKLLQKLKDQETEIRLFEEKIHHLADQMIRIDLDDGVKHNYEIFGDVLTKLK